MKLIIALIAMFLANFASAQSAGTSETGIRYNEIGIGYNSVSVSGTTLTGYSVGASALVEKNILLNASYENVSKSSNSITNTSVGVGYRFGIASNVDASARVGYFSAGGDLSENSYIVGGGIDALVAPNLSIAGNVSYSGLGSGTYFYSGTVGYYVTEAATLKASVRRSTGDFATTTYLLSAGYNF
jgi:hypothetical protein